MHCIAHFLIHTYIFILDVDADFNSDVLHVGRRAELGRVRDSSWTSSEIGTLDSAVSG